MSLRFPPALRARLRRYARSRGLEEATAVRTLCADRLREIDLKEELELAERWQLEEALRRWDGYERGDAKTYDVSELDDVFRRARARFKRSR